MANDLGLAPSNQLPHNPLSFKETIATMHDELNYAKNDRRRQYQLLRNRNPTWSEQQLLTATKDKQWKADLFRIGDKVMKIDQPNPDPRPWPQAYYQNAYVQPQPQPAPQPQAAPQPQLAPQPQPQAMSANQQKSDGSPRPRAGTYSGSTQQTRGQESVRPRSYHEGDKPHTKQHPLQRAPSQAQGTSSATHPQHSRQGSVKTRRQIADEGQSHVISGEEQAPRQLSGRPISYHEADKQLHDAEVKPHHDPLLHPQGDDLSPEQQATHQLGDETAADIKTSQPTDPNPKQMKLKWHQTRRGRCIIGLVVLAVLLTILAVLVGYFCGYKEAC